jgi:hypothetical protein
VIWRGYLVGGVDLEAKVKDAMVKRGLKMHEFFPLSGQLE